MNREKRNSIFVILKDVEKFMAKHLTYEHTFAGILEKDLLCATGCFVAKDSQGVMSFRDIEEPIQVSWFIQDLYFLLISFSTQMKISAIAIKLEIQKLKREFTLVIIWKMLRSKFFTSFLRHFILFFISFINVRRLPLPLFCSPKKTIFNLLTIFIFLFFLEWLPYI